jgi:hypothetical protein
LAYPYAVFDTTTARSKTLRHQSKRLVTWAIHETEQRPAIKITDLTVRQTANTPNTPWPVSYDCLIEVSVRSLAIDIVWSIESYHRRLQSDHEVRGRFAECMKHYFPQ